jgi:hypothetical protein
VLVLDFEILFLFLLSQDLNLFYLIREKMAMVGGKLTTRA